MVFSLVSIRDQKDYIQADEESQTDVIEKLYLKTNTSVFRVPISNFFYQTHWSLVKSFPSMFLNLPFNLIEKRMK